MHSTYVRYFAKCYPFLPKLFLLEVTMSCVAARGYFEQIDEAGLVYYKNNALSMVLSKTHPSSLKDAVGFMCVVFP